MLDHVIMMFYQQNHKIFANKHWLLCIFAIFLSTILTACQSLNTPPHQHKSQIISQQSLQLQTQLTNNHTLLKKISKHAPKHNNLSGYYPIITSFDAFSSRNILTTLANHSIDVQYYIWHNDEAGQIMLKQLYHSANRGVKVRLLLDDLNTNPQLDQILLKFSKHPNIAVRLINPKKIRHLTPVNFAVAMPRYHRRMHNKSMIFDKQLSIIGGRNIGDEYLRSDSQNEFADLDVLLAGKVVNTINDSFEQYWQSDLAYDIEVLVKDTSSETADFLSSLDKINQQNSTIFFPKDDANRKRLDKVLQQGLLTFRWAKIDFFSDNIKKLVKDDNKSERLISQLRETIGTPKKDFSIISSYFVPTNLGIKQLNQLVNDGVNVRVLTNSFHATDVPIVHAGYREARLPMLKGGVQLYELKSSIDADLRKKKSTLSKQEISTSLHTKAFAVDNRLVFIGSYNFDPRSANINTELGVVIYDAQFATAIHQMFDDRLLNISYRLDLLNNRIIWQTLEQPNPMLLLTYREPNLSVINDIWIRFFSILPIQWLL